MRSDIRPFPEQINFRLCLAPMVGLSHVALRQVVREYLPQGARTFWPTEMLSSWRLLREDLGDTPETQFATGEEDLVPQILGNEEIPIAESVKKLTNWGVSAIDINMGCPVKKALKHNYGVSLMGDPDYAAFVVDITKKNSTIPISVKLRAPSAGTHDEEYFDRFCKGLIDAGADWLCLHPRTADQMRRGRADWEQIARLKKKSHVPIIGNGDIQSAQCVQHMLEQTGCDMVMSGRALAAKPWLLWQLGRKWGFDEPQVQAGRNLPVTAQDEAKEYGRVCVRLIHYLREYFVHPETQDEAVALRKLRFYIRMSSVWLDFGHELNSIVTKLTNLDDIEASLIRFFENSLEMTTYTELRQ